MNAKSFLTGTVVGAIVFFVLGILFYGIIFMEFFQQNAGSASGVMKDPPDVVHLFIGELAFGALYTYIFLQWANIKSFAGGAKGGAVIGFLLGLGYNLISFSTSNVMNLSGSLMDSVLSLISGAIGGAIIGWVLGRLN